MAGDDHERVHLGRLSPGDVALLKNIAREAAKEPVREFSPAMGIDPEDPLRAQANMQWLDRRRTREDGLFGKAMNTAIAVAVIGALGWLWTGFKTAISFA